MKKFMIFLLMAFLYLGTCQARSEATHFNDANVKLHSWVTPSTSQPFTMDVKSILANPIVTVSPSQPQNLCLTCPHSTATFAVNYDDNGTGESMVSRVWMVNGHNTDSTGTTFTFAGYAAGQYTVACKVVTDYGYTYTSNYVEVTVDMDVIVNIVGPDQACQNDVVTLTAQVENSSLECTYQWRRDGQYIVGATSPSYSFLVSDLPGLTDTLVYEFDVQITRAGCDSKYSPVHYFMVAPTPVPEVDVPLFCAGNPVTLTANAYTAGSVQPYMWKWINTTSNDTTVTYVNTVTIANPTSGEVYKVIPIYQDYACNADTAEVTLVSYQDSLHITELQNLELTATPEKVCLDGMVQLKVTDPNKTVANIGDVTYTWYMDGAPVAGITDSIYTATLSTSGTHNFKVVASYENFPCGNPEATKEVVVDTVPAAVVITGNNILCQAGDGSYNTTTLTAEVTPSTGTYEYKWTGDTDFGTSSTKDVSAPGVYAVIVKTAAGCETMSLPIQVYGFGADVQITNTQSTCAGQPVTLNVNADGWTSNVTYTWENGQHTSTITVTPTEDTWYKVTSTATLINGTTCERTDSIQVVVMALPNAPEVETKTANICEGALASVNIVNPVAGEQYVWYQNGVEIPGFNLSSISVQLDAAGTYDFTAAVVNANGCVSAPSTTPATVTVEAAPSLVSITGTDVICEGSMATLTVHAVGAATTDPYLWSTGATTESIDVGAGTYSVTVTSDNGCSTSAEYTVHALGSDVQITASSQQVCAGQDVTLNVSVTGWGEGNISYEWEGITDGAHSNQVTFKPDKSGYYKVTTTVTSTAGTCSRVDSIYIDVIDLKITDAHFIGNDTICLGAQATMTAVCADADFFVWYENGVEIPGQNLDTIRVMPQAAGSYIYSVAAIQTSTGCVSTDSTLIPELVVLDNPTIEITGDPIVCNDSTIHLIALLNDTTNTNANGATYTYEWRLYNNSLVNGSNTVDGVDYDFTINNDTLETEVHSQDHPYIFTVTAMNENGCVATSEPYNVYVGSDIEVAVTVDRDTVCKGGLVTATAHLGDFNMSNLVYNWYIVTEAAGYTDTTWISDATSITYTTSVEESLKMGVKITQTTTGCTIMGDTTVTVLTPEIIKVIVSNETHNDGTDFTVCEGEDVYVTAYLEDETGNQVIDSSLTYVWYENGFLMPGVDGPTFHKQLTIIDEDTTTYVYTAYIDFGVEGCVPKPVASNKVHVNRNPIVTIAGNHNVCYFGTFEDAGVYNVHLIAWVNGGFDTTLTYTWYEHGQLREGVGGSNYDNHYRENWIPTYDNPYSFTVMVSDSNGCTTISEPFEVNIYNKPVVNITTTENTICDGGNVVLTAHIDNYNDPMLYYQWYANGTDPDNLLPGMTEPVETFYPEDTTTYIVKVTHLLENGLMTQQACFNTASIAINVNDDPVIDSVTTDLAEGNDTICEGRYVTFTAHISGGVTGGEIFTWYRNGEIIPDAVDSVYRETPQAINGDITVYDYAVSVRQTASGCESNVTPADTITVYPNPVLVLVTDPIVCDTLTDNIVMYANVTPAPTSSYSFTWYEDNAEITDGTLSGAHNDTIKITRPYRDYEYSFAVELVNDYGCTTRDEATVYVNDNPIVHATVTEDSICIGGEITLTANLDDYNANMLEFHWYDNGQLIGTATELTYTTVPTLGEHKYNMTAFQRNSLCIASSDTVIVNVLADPIIDSVTTDLADGNDTICEGRFVTLTAHISGGVTGGEIFTWYRNGQIIEGAVDSVYQETPQAENGDPTTYDYTVTVRQTAAGCESSANGYNTITVLPNPVLELVTDPIVCDTLENNIVMYANVTPAPTSAYSFTWYEDNQVLADGTMMGSHNDSIKLTRPYRDYPYSFSVELVNEYGCTTRDDATIYVNDNPIIHATVTEDSICIGGQITLTANLDDYNADMLEFHWYDNGQLIGTATELTYTTVPTLGEHRYNMTALQRNSLCIASSDTMIVNVLADPVIDSVTTDLAEGNDTICEGRFVTLTAHISGGVTGGEIFTWYRNGQIIEGAVDSVYQETPQAINGDPTTYDYTVTVRQTASGCESSANGYNTITVLPNPVLVLVTDPIVCDTLENNIVMYANVTPAPTSSYSFTWYEDNQVLADGTMMGEHNDSIKLTRPYRDYPYSFAVELVNSYGCTTRDDATIYVNDNPIVHATVTEDSICIGGEITLTANLDDYNADMLEFHWYDNGELIGTATELTYTVVPTLGEHKYNMTALQRNSLCIASSDTVIVNVLADPVIDSVTSDLADGNDTICEGRFVTLTAHISGGVTGGEIFTWYRNGEIIEGAVDSVYQETPQAENGDPTTYDYTVSVRQTAAGCESDVNGYNTITVLPNPVLVLVTDPIVCDTLENNIVMYANVTPAPTSAYSFTWYEDNQVLADGTMMGEHNDSIKLTRPYRDYEYSFAVELVNDYGCSVRDEATVYVNDNPIVHATVTDDTLCIGGEITLTANLDDYNADMLEFHWYDNGELIGTATELTYTTVPTLGEHRYNMTALQRNSLCIASSDTVVVLVKPDPIISEVVLSDYIACEGAQIRVEAIADETTYTPSATDVYTWYRNGVRILGATDRVLYDTPVTVDQNTQQYIYTAVVTLEEPGCTSLPVASEALTIYRNPVVAITGDQHVCETDYTFLIANVDTVGMNVGNLHYTWFINGDIRDNNAYNLGDNRFFAEYLYPRDEPYIFTVTVERGDIANACSSTSEPFEVYVYPKPEVNITANVTDICENGEVTLQANLNDYNADHMTFQWYEVRNITNVIAVDYLPGGGYVYDTVVSQYNYYIPGATGFHYTTTLTETTTLGVVVTQTTSQCYDIDEFTVTVHPTPAAPVITVNNPMICSNGDVDLVITNDYSEYGTPIYAWMLNGHVIPGTYGPVYHQEPGLVDGTTHHYNAIVTFNMPGCMSVVSDTADVVVIPDPVVTVTVDGPTAICEGGSVTFSANPQPTTLDYTYQWYDHNNQLMVGDTNSTLTVSPNANQQNYQYLVVVNSLPGCQVVANAPVVTVVADPVVTLSIDNPIICQGGQSTLTVNVEGGIANVNGIDPYSYAWYSNNNTETPFAVTSDNFYVLPTNLETDSFAYWVEVSANMYGCATTSEHVNQLVVADPIVNIIVAPTYPETVCDGGNTMLVATVQGGFGDNSYQWYRNETILVGETNPTLNTGILSVNDINSYRVIVTQTGSGCETVSDTFQVPVIPTYEVVVSALNNPTVCEGGTTTMEAAIINAILPNDNPTFQWYEIIDGANVAIAGATSTRYTTSPLLMDGNHTYFVAVTSQVTGSGCSSHSNSFYTSIVDDPTVTVSTTAVNNVICEGDVVQVNATVAPAGGSYTYNWTWTNGTNSYTYSTTEPTFAPTDLPASINGYLFNVSIVSTDANSGCNATSNSNVYVTVMPRPVVTISADNEVVCAGGHVELTANHNASDYTGFNYAWTVNGYNHPSTLQTITVPASMVTAGNITASVVVTSSQLSLNCTSTATLTQPVQVLAQPTVTLSADHLTMCANAAPTLTATVNGNTINTPMTFVWKRNGSIIPAATGSVYQSEPLSAGTYNFQVMALSENTELNCNSDWSADNAVVVRVAETPVVSLASADGTLDLCEGGNITLTATVINANNTVGDFTNSSIYGAYNYVWIKDNNVVATNNNITLPQNQITETLNNYGYYTYNVNLTPVGPLAFGCGTVMAQNPVEVHVHLKPNWDAAVVYAHDGNICLGEEVQLHAHITGGVADMNGNTNGHIQWVVEFNGVASNVSNYGGDATHTPTVPGLYTYYPTYVAYEGSIIGSGCAFTNSNDQVSTFVTVHALPTAAFVSGNGTTICANVSDDNAALTIHFTGTPPFHFTVDDLSNGTSVMYDSYTNDYVIYVSPDHTTQYRITYLSDNYCTNGELGLDAIATIFVNDIQFEETFFQAECGEDVVTINFNMLSGTPNSDFIVTYDNGMVVTGTISNNTATFATPSVPGDYHAVFSVGGCNYDIIVRRPVGENDFTDGSTPFMMQRWDDVVIINNNPATNGGHTFVSYQWYRNGEAIPGAIYKNYQEIGGLNGYYSIEVVSQDADGRTVTYRTCEQFFSSSSSVRVYPVPANVQQVITIEIDMTAEELEGATLDIYDVTGSLVDHVSTVEPVTRVQGFKAAGTYFGRIMMASGETKTVKFVIVK